MPKKFVTAVEENLKMRKLRIDAQNSRHFGYACCATDATLNIKAPNRKFFKRRKSLVR